MSRIYVREPDDAARGMVAALSGGALVLLLLAALVWLATRVSEPPAAAAAPLAVARPAAPSASAAVARAAVAPPAPVALPPGQVDVCGVGPVKVSDWSGSVRREALDTGTAASSRRTATALKTSPDPLAQGLGWAMEYRLAKAAAARAPVDGEPGPGADLRRRPPAGTVPREALARLAADTRAPELFALAWRTCGTEGLGDTESACRQLTADQWTRIDPENALAWSAALDQARQKHDQAAVAEALFRMSLARSVDRRTTRLASLAAAHLPAGTPVLESEGVVKDVAMDDGAALDGGASALKECSAVAVRDANRWQHCVALADVFWQHGTKSTDLVAAVGIGKVVGWSAEQVEGRRTEAQAVSHVTTEMLAESAPTCDAVRRRISQYTDRSRLNEVAWARRVISESGRSVAQWNAVALARRPETAASAPPSGP